MSSEARLRAAIEKLEVLRGDSWDWRVAEDEDGPQVLHDFDTEGYGCGTGPLAWTTSALAGKNIVTLHRTIDAQLDFLRAASTDTSRLVSGTATTTLGVPSYVAIALALADAVLGDS